MTLLCNLGSRCHQTSFSGTKFNFPKLAKIAQKIGVLYAKKYTSLKKVHYCRAGSGGSDYYELRKKKVNKIVYLAQLEWLVLAGGVEMELGERGSVKSHFDSCPTPGMGGKSSLN